MGLKIMVWDARFGQVFTGWATTVLCGLWMLLFLLVYPLLVRLAKAVQKKDLEWRKEFAKHAKEIMKVLAPPKGGKASNVSKMINPTGSMPMSPLSSAGTFVTTKTSNTFAVSTAASQRADTLPHHLVARSRTVEGLWHFRHKMLFQILYYLLASMAGVYLSITILLKDDPLPRFLVSFSSRHQLIYSGVVSFWIRAFVEDFRGRHWMGLGFHVGGRGCGCGCCSCSWDDQVYYISLLHHAVLIFVYIYILATFQLGGLGVQGLLFEAPAALLAWRRLACSSDVPPFWLMDPPTIRMHWTLTMLMFLLARGMASCMWIYTLIPGKGADIVEEYLTENTRLVYHSIAAFFTLANACTFVLMFRWRAMDIDRAEEAQLEMEDFGTASMSSPVSAMALGRSSEASA